MGRKNKHKKPHCQYQRSGSKSLVLETFKLQIRNDLDEAGAGAADAVALARAPTPKMFPMEPVRFVFVLDKEHPNGTLIEVEDKDFDPSLGFQQPIPKYEHLYRCDSGSLRLEAFESAAVGIYRETGCKFQKIITDTSFLGLEGLEAGSFEWNMALLPPKWHACAMLIRRAVCDYLNTLNSESEIDIVEKCGMSEAGRNNWDMCDDSGVCNVCYSTNLKRFEEARTGTHYAFKELRVMGPATDGYYTAQCSIVERLVRFDENRIIQMQLCNLTTLRALIPKNATTGIHVIRAGLVRLVAGAAGAGMIADDPEWNAHVAAKLELPDGVDPDPLDSNGYGNGEIELGAVGGAGAGPTLTPVSFDPHGGHEHHQHKVCKIFGCGSNTCSKVRGIKEWRPLELGPSDKQFVLRLAMKYHIQADESKILQFILSTLNHAPSDIPQLSTGLPKFAKVKTSKRKNLHKKDFAKFELSPEDYEKLSLPWGYLDYLDNNLEDGVFLLALADTVGLGKVKGEMIAVIEKHFGCDVRIEQIRSELKKCHKPIKAPFSRLARAAPKEKASKSTPTDSPVP